MDDNAPSAVRRRAPHDKRGAILAAARVLFQQHGFDGTSMETIAGRAMVSKVTVYAHFASKEVLLRTILEAPGAGLAQSLDCLAGVAGAVRATPGCIGGCSAAGVCQQHVG